MGGETEKDSWVYVTWVCLLFCQKSPDGEPGVTLLFWWQRVLCGFSPAPSKHFIIGVGGQTLLHDTKLDGRTNVARIHMLLPRPPINRKPSLWFQQPALRCDHRTSADVPRSEKQTGGIHREPEKGHRQSPEFYHFFPWSTAVSCICSSFNFLR